MSQKEIEKVNLGKDIPYILQNTPSVVVTSDAGTGIGYTGMNIRGTDLTRINVTVNGIPSTTLNRRGSGSSTCPILLPPRKTSRCSAGVGTSTNGAGAFGATVNIMTTAPGRCLRRADRHGRILRNGTGHAQFRHRNLRKQFCGRRQGVLPYLRRIYRPGFRPTCAPITSRQDTTERTPRSETGHLFRDRKDIPGMGRSARETAWQTNRTFNPAGKYYDSAGNIRYYKNQTDNYQQDHYQLIFSQKLGQQLEPERGTLLHQRIRLLRKLQAGRIVFRLRTAGCD